MIVPSHLAWRTYTGWHFSETAGGGVLWPRVFAVTWVCTGIFLQCMRLMVKFSPTGFFIWSFPDISWREKGISGFWCQPVERPSSRHYLCISCSSFISVRGGQFGWKQIRFYSIRKNFDSIRFSGLQPFMNSELRFNHRLIYRGTFANSAISDTALSGLAFSVAQLWVAYTPVWPEMHWLTVCPDAGKLLCDLWERQVTSQY